MIRNAGQDDIPALVQIHREALPNDLLPRLGAAYLRKEFYPRVLERDRALTLVSEEDNRLNGFCVFAYDGDSLTREIMRKRITIARYLVLACLKDRSLVAEAVACLRGFRTSLLPGCEVDLRSLPEIYLIATSPSCQSRGIGARIVEQGIEILFREHSVCLTKTSSDRSKQFYLRNGFVEVGVEHRGRRSLSVLLRRREEDGPR
jgi:ribosomal protein S18 acetylase RimI-like enzyme